MVDAAAAIGTKGSSDQKLGELGFDAVCYSFNGNKTVTSGGGGAVVSNDNAIVDRIRHLSTTGRVGPAYDHDVVAYNFRMTNLQAAVGVAQIERLPEFLAAKKRIHNSYSVFSDAFSSLSGFPEPNFGINGHWFSGLFYEGQSDSVAERFRTHMRKNEIDLRPFWKPIHLQSPYAGALCEDLPVTEDIWSKIFPLPCSTHLSEKELNKVLAAAKEFWRN